MVHVQLFKIVCLTLMCLPSTCSQSLYENDYKQYQTFNRESRDCSLHYSLDITRVLQKKTGFNLKECNGRHNDILDAYNILMGMYNQGLKPNGMYSRLGQCFAHFCCISFLICVMINYIATRSKIKGTVNCPVCHFLVIKWLVSYFVTLT